MSLIKKLAGETVIYGMSSILPRLLQYLIGMTYITYRFEEQQQVGLYHILYAYTAVFLTILLFRLDTAYFRFAGKEDSSAVFSTAFISIALSTLLVCGSVFIGAGWLSGHLEARDNPQYLRWFAMIIGFDTLSMLFYARLRYEQRPLRFLAFRVGNVILYIAFVFLLLEIVPRLAPDLANDIGNFFGVVREIDYTFVANLLASAIVFLAMLPQLRAIRISFDAALWRRMINYSWPLVIVGVASIFSMTFATPLQEYFLSDDLIYNRQQAGIYGSVAKVAVILNLMIVGFNYAAEPFFFKHADDRNKGELYGKIAHVFTIVIGAAVVLVVAYLDQLQFLIGSSYRSGLYVVPYLLFAFLFLGLYYNVSIWYKLSDKTLVGAIISIVGMLIMLGFNIWFLPQIGIVASAYAALICYAVMVVLGYWTGQHYYPIQYPLRSIMTYVGLAAVLVVAMTWARSMHVQHVWLLGTMSVLIYAIVVYLRDRSYLRSILK